jgi:hypothetical protein
MVGDGDGNGLRRFDSREHSHSFLNDRIHTQPGS